MTHLDHRLEDKHHHERSFVGHALIEYMFVLAFVVVVGGVAIAELGGALNSLVHSISIVV